MQYVVTISSMQELWSLMKVSHEPDLHTGVIYRRICCLTGDFREFSL